MHVHNLDAGVDAQAIEHQQNADDGDEHQRQDGHFRVRVDEVGDGVDEHHHQDNRRDNRDDHDDEVIGQTDRRDNRVDGEHHVHHHDGGDGAAEADGLARLVGIALAFLFLGKVQQVAKLGHAFVDKVQTAQEQDKVAHGKAQLLVADEDAWDVEQLVGHMHQERGEAQEDAARDERGQQAQLAAQVLLFGRQPVGGKNDEHQIVHAKNDLQEHQGYQADPRFGRCENREVHVLLCLSFSSRP